MTLKKTDLKKILAYEKTTNVTFVIALCVLFALFFLLTWLFVIAWNNLLSQYLVLNMSKALMLFFVILVVSSLWHSGVRHG